MFYFEGEGTPFACGKKGFLPPQTPPSSPKPAHKEYFQLANHTACRVAEKARFFRSLRAGRRCTAASRFVFFKVETLLPLRRAEEQSPRRACSFYRPDPMHAACRTQQPRSKKPSRTGRLSFEYVLPNASRAGSIRKTVTDYFLKNTAISLRPSTFSRTFSSGREAQCFLLEK